MSADLKSVSAKKSYNSGDDITVGVLLRNNGAYCLLDGVLVYDLVKGSSIPAVTFRDPNNVIDSENVISEYSKAQRICPGGEQKVVVSLKLPAQLLPGDYRVDFYLKGPRTGVAGSYETYQPGAFVALKVDGVGLPKVQIVRSETRFAGALYQVGPVIDRNSYQPFYVSMLNSGQKDFSGNLRVRICSFGEFSGLGCYDVGSYDVSLVSGTKGHVQGQISMGYKPDVYSISYELLDKEGVLQSIYKNRFIISGHVASLRSVSADKIRYDKGETVDLQVGAVGPYSFSETNSSTKGVTLETDFYDDSGFFERRVFAEEKKFEQIDNNGEAPMWSTFKAYNKISSYTLCGLVKVAGRTVDQRCVRSGESSALPWPIIDIVYLLIVLLPLSVVYFISKPFLKKKLPIIAKYLPFVIIFGSLIISSYIVFQPTKDVEARSPILPGPINPIDTPGLTHEQLQYDKQNTDVDPNGVVGGPDCAYVKFYNDRNNDSLPQASEQISLLQPSDIVPNPNPVPNSYFVPKGTIAYLFRPLFDDPSATVTYNGKPHSLFGPPRGSGDPPESTYYKCTVDLGYGYTCGNGTSFEASFWPIYKMNITTNGESSYTTSDTFSFHNVTAQDLINAINANTYSDSGFTKKVTINPPLSASDVTNIIPDLTALNSSGDLTLLNSYIGKDDATGWPHPYPPAQIFASYKTRCEATGSVAKSQTDQNQMASVFGADLFLGSVGPFFESLKSRFSLSSLGIDKNELLAALPASWTPRSSAHNWVSVAMSSDGTYQTALDGGGGNGYIYRSTDSGTTWAAMTGAGYRYWNSVAMSSNGQIQTAVSGNLNYIVRSTDYGASWTQVTGAGSRCWNSVAVSSDGIVQIATDQCNNGVGNGGYIYRSIDSGVTWVAITGPGVLYWGSVAMSANGVMQTANDGSNIYYSTNSGVSWTKGAAAPAGGWYWKLVAISGDGIVRIAVPGWTATTMYKSTDSGTTWGPITSAGSKTWTSVALSSDGRVQTAVASDGQIYVSYDTGVTWALLDSVRNWRSVAMTPDGLIQTAVVNGGQIYNSSDSTTKPLAPNLSTLTPGDGTVTVNWTLAPGANGYRVYRDITPTFTTSALNLVSDVSSGTTISYLDDNNGNKLNNCSTYYYKVTAYNNSGESLPQTTGAGAMPMLSSADCLIRTATTITPGLYNNQVTTNFLSSNVSGHYAKYFKFSGTQGDTITIRMDGSAAYNGGNIYFMDTAGTVLGHDDLTGSYPDSSYITVSKFSLPSTDNYIIEADSLSPNNSFNLSLDECTPASIFAGVNNNLIMSSCRTHTVAYPTSGSYNGVTARAPYANYYRYSATQGDVMRIILQPVTTTFTSNRLYLMNPATGGIIAPDQNTGTIPSGKYLYTFAVPYTGAYIIEAASDWPLTGVPGDKFNLEIDEYTPQNITGTLSGQVLSSNWDITSSNVSTPRKNYYKLTANKGDFYTITMDRVSTSFSSPDLYVYNPVSGAYLTYGSYSTYPNQIISNYSMPYTGDYIIRAGSGSTSDLAGLTFNLGINKPVPLTPANFAVANGDSRVTITWSASTAASSYYLYKKIGTGTVTTSDTLVGGSSTTTLKVIDSDVLNGSTYSYAVLASNSTGNSALSTTLPATPNYLPLMTDIVITPLEGKLQVNWAPSTYATSYNLFSYYSTPVGTTYQVAGSPTSGTSLTFTTSGPNYYQLRANNSIGSTFTTTKLGLARPLPPTGLTVTEGNTKLTITWVSSQDSSGYKLYRDTNSNISTTTPTTSVWVSGAAVPCCALTDSGLQNSTTYYYKVVGTNSSGDSSFSNLASGIPVSPPSVPTGLTISSADRALTISWLPSTGTVRGYKLYRYTSQTGSGTIVNAATPTVTTFTDNNSSNGLTNGATYYYKVSSYNGAGDSALSDWISGVPVYLGGCTQTNMGANNYSTTSTLSTTDCLSRASGRYGDVYLFTSNAPSSNTLEQLVITASSTATLDSSPYLSIRRPNGDPVLYNYYDYDYPLPSGITAWKNSKLVFNATTSLNYVLEMSSHSYYDNTNGTNHNSQVGAYGLNFSRLTCAVNTINAGETKIGSLDTTDCFAAYDVYSSSPAYSYQPNSYGLTGSYADYYSFSGLVNNNLTVNLSYPSKPGDSKVTLIDPNGNWLIDGTISGSTSTISNYKLLQTGTYLIEAKTYYRNELGKYTLSIISPPSPPATVSVTPMNGLNVLFWSASPGVITGYKLFRNGAATPFLTVGANILTATDTPLTNGTSYSYQIKSYNGAGDSGPSTTVYGTPLSPPSTSPTALAATTGSGVSPQVNLSWTGVSGTISGYRVYRSTSPSVSTSTATLVAITIAGTTSAIDKTVSNNTTYYYRVLAYNTAGDSLLSTPDVVVVASTYCTVSSIDTSSTGQTIVTINNITYYVDLGGVRGYLWQTGKYSGKTTRTYTLDPSGTMIAEHVLKYKFAKSGYYVFDIVLVNGSRQGTLTSSGQNSPIDLLPEFIDRTVK